MSLALEAGPRCPRQRRGEGRGPGHIGRHSPWVLADGVWLMDSADLWLHSCISSLDQRTELPSTQHSLPHLCFFSSWGAHVLEVSVGARSTATPTPKGSRLFSIENHSGFPKKAYHTNMKQCALFLVLVYFWVTRTSRILMRSDVD